MRLWRYFTREGIYVFPPQQEGGSNFGNAVQRTVRLPGMHGGFDEYGNGRAPGEMGNVRAMWYLRAQSMQDMRRKVDEAWSMADARAGLLFQNPYDGGPMRWTHARISDISGAESVFDRPDISLRVTANFQCRTGRWYSRADQVFSNDGWMSDTSLLGMTPQVYQQAVQNGSTVTVTNTGNAWASPFIRWEGDGSDTFTDPVLSRYDPDTDELIDQITYTGTVGINDVIEIDCRNFKVTPNYDAVSVNSASWLLLPPGSTTLKVTGTFPGDGLLTIDYWDTWVGNL